MMMKYDLNDFEHSHLLPIKALHGSERGAFLWEILVSSGEPGEQNEQVRTHPELRRLSASCDR